MVFRDGKESCLSVGVIAVYDGRKSETITRPAKISFLMLLLKSDERGESNVCFKLGERYYWLHVWGGLNETE